MPPARAGGCPTALAALGIALAGCHGAAACVLQGVDAGYCAAAQDVQDKMPFCGGLVTYTTCVPRTVPWFGNVSVANKDAWASSTFNAFVAQRIGIENGKIQPSDQTLYNLYTGNETKRFTGNSAQDCINAYKNYMCWMNFPRCDPAGNSLLLCRSVCENFFQACRYPKPMWRCYDPMYYGGQYPEGGNGDQVYSSTGSPVFLRALFPGLPFRENEYEDNKVDPVAVCTPSIKGGARAAALSMAVAAAGLAAVAVLATGML